MKNTLAGIGNKTHLIRDFIHQLKINAKHYLQCLVHMYRDYAKKDAELYEGVFFTVLQRKWHFHHYPGDTLV